MRLASVGMLLLATASFGCSSADTLGGELGDEGFAYYCVSPERDAADCDEGGYCGSFPDHFAVGGEFMLGFDGSGSSSNIIPGSRMHAAVDSSKAIIKVEGPASFLAIDRDERVVDLIHLDAYQVSSIDLNAPPSMTVDTWFTGTIIATPLSEDDQVLAGTLAYEWSSSNEGVVALLGTTDEREVELEAVGSGQAIVTVIAGTGISSVTINVEGDES